MRRLPIALAALAAAWLFTPSAARGETENRVDAIPFYVHVDVAPGQVDASRLERWIVKARRLLFVRQEEEDASCCLDLQGVSLQPFGESGDGLDVLDSQEKFEALAALGPGGYIVSSILWCERPAPSAIGCAQLGGDVFAVALDAGPEVFPQVIAHERGHNAGLEHDTTDWCKLMYPASSRFGQNGCLDGDECAAFRTLGIPQGTCPCSPGADVFQAIADPRDDTADTNAYGVSGDGRVVVGQAGPDAFRWEAGELQVLPGSPGASESAARSASFDGSVVVGRTRSDGFYFQAASWDDGGSLSVLTSELDSSAWSVSDDGRIIAGWGPDGNAYMRAMRWVDGVREPLGDLTDFSDMSQAWAVSGDGRVVVGDWDVRGQLPDAFRWTPELGYQDLGNLYHFEARRDGVAFAASRDGSVIVGHDSVWSGPNLPFRWENGIHPLDRLTPDSINSSATDVSADGSVVVGSSDGDAVLWNAAGQVQSIEEMLTYEMGIDLSAWRLEWAYGVSADGRVIVGNGRYLGQRRGWVVSIPEVGGALAPSAAVAALVLLGLARGARLNATAPIPLLPAAAARPRRSPSRPAGCTRG